METKYNGKSNKGGIYRIINLVNNKIYVGSAKGFKQRYRHHVESLRKGTHHNKHLQASFNKHGEDVFLFEVLEVVEGEQSERLIAEQKHIDVLIKQGKWEETFNFKKKTIAKSRSCFSKTPEETRKKRSESSKKMWQDPEYRRQQSEIQTIRTKEQWEVPGEREKRSDSLKTFYSSEEGAKEREKISKKMSERVVSEESRKKISKTVSKKNVEMWQDESYRKKTIEGRKKSWAKDPKRKKDASQRMREFASKTYHLVDPNGNAIAITNLQEYCKKSSMKLIPHCLSQVARGVRQNYKGWTSPKG